ncbi:MAG: TonB-dependent receptor [Sphingomonas sp.]|uniref:TonB-dependent receptor plug domain-containing protein n=1 Tax=Sphingomonas sp. TaxID=28214 RepID=UPI0025E2B524|nr:TonB-dependent receptor [Sphingomonas sp.]MBX3565532.1 TonB-dependent receptor [Sphingomonas sp.]
MRKTSYLTSTILCSAFAAMALPSAALAQEAKTAPAATGAAKDEQAADEGEAIVVTGSLFRRTNTETPSPITVLSAATLEERGINTVSEAMQRLTANGAGNISQGWNAAGNFAAGATAPSLRGLTVQATLSISDGLRMAPYPLADDGQRNFVDLNSIPSATIERIEVLRDGASSTYGADAIAGVINIITKKEIKGLHLNASAGISQRGDAGEQRVSGAWGIGDLNEQGFNFYLSGEYQKQDRLLARDRGYPFNSSDLSRLCNAAGSCRNNGIQNAVTTETGIFNGLFAISGVTLIRPITAAGTNTGAGRFTYLNPGAGCLGRTTGTITAAQSPTSPLTICQTDPIAEYGHLLPSVERFGGSARFTANLGDRAQLYAIASFYDSKVKRTAQPSGYNGLPQPPRPAGQPTYNTVLPVYVCAAGVGTFNGTNTGCTAANGVLNPYNPYAALGQTAQVLYRDTRPVEQNSDARSLRGVIGVDGTFGDGWNYSASFTAMNVRLLRAQLNYPNLQHIMDVVARGEFNFFNPSATPQSVLDYISPASITRSSSDLWQLSGTLTKDLFELPGGPLQAAVGGQMRYESINAPSANPANLIRPYDRYLVLNAVGTKGSRRVKSGFFEINAPIVKELELNVSGRYDSYSSGQSNFSPKVGAKFTPIPQIAVRGTYSKGFRIPSFNEAFGLPTTGFTNQTLSPSVPAQAAFIALHGNNAYATNPFPLGTTTVGNPSLTPEKSTSITAGAVFEPIRNVSLTVDYWQIKIKGLIAGVTDVAPAIAAYYANNGVVNIPGINVLPGLPDVALPNALPHIGFIEASYTNTDSQFSSGIDVGANVNVNITDGIRLNSSFEASYQLRYELIQTNGVKLNYTGTLSPCSVTSCSGAPRLRATWQNTLDFGDTKMSVTAYYTSGYDNASVDEGGIAGNCAANAATRHRVQVYNDQSPVLCRAKPTWNVDLTASQKINENFLLYVNVLNVLDIKPPYDPSSSYGQFQYNPAWAGPNMMGRYFKVGAKIDF